MYKATNDKCFCLKFTSMLHRLLPHRQQAEAWIHRFAVGNYPKAPVSMDCQFGYELGHADTGRRLCTIKQRQARKSQPSANLQKQQHKYQINDYWLTRKLYCVEWTQYSIRPKGPLYATGVSLGPPESSTQTTSRSLHLFSQSSLGDRPTDRPTDHATRSVTIGGAHSGEAKFCYCPQLQRVTL